MVGVYSSLIQNKDVKNKCVICGSLDSKIIFKNYPGYIENTFFDIYKCNDCDSHFVITTNEIKNIYDIIYSNVNTFGYDRYYRYATIVKKTDNPLKFLAFKESTYYPVYEFLKDKDHLKILEVGCGYGYLSYALHKNGFNVQAIDIAKDAINYARKNFGDYYFNMNINEYSKQTDEKFDLIIATEVIEHLEDPNIFLDTCLKLLKQEGNILLTTPDKDYSQKDSVWQTDLPPVHAFWIGKKGIKILAKKHNLDVKTQDFSKYYSKYENRMVKYLVSRRERIGNFALTEEGEPIKKMQPSFLHSKISLVVHKIPLVRFFSNFIYNKINGSEITLGVILKKNLRN